ncbi:ParB N-terminal domain-containing protein [Nocardia sp. NPDC005978]|uniref:ParB/RepB/Spo0J family partition protein n=1 Tax=Nocardia sp. NPDC005978 TaxID=3156725 RepID=UPI0033BEA4E9
MTEEPGRSHSSAERYAQAVPDEPTLSEIIELPIGRIAASGSIRASGLDHGHLRLLCELHEPHPPIVVHRVTMRIIDGFHRLEAARLRGATTVQARFFDGTDQEAYVLAVKANAVHGLPLSLSDRKRAATQILQLFPDWSDRRVAGITGVAHKTVGAIRRRAGGEIPHLERRVGRDGRLQRSDRRGTSSDGQARVRAPIAENQSTPIRPAARPSGRASSSPQADLTPAIRSLRADPSLRFSDAGRALLRWLDAGPRTLEESVALADQIPGHCSAAIVAVARRNAEHWQSMADELDRRLHSRKGA